MMALDPTIPLGIKPPQTGLAALGQTLDTARGVLGLQSASQQLGANQAISRAYAEATDPATGQVDFGKLQALAAQNGGGAFLPEFMGKIAQQRNQQVQYDTGKLELALKQQQDIRNRIGSLLASPNLGKNDVTPEVIQQVSEAVSNGTLPLDQAQRVVASIPKDPALQKQWATQNYLNSLSGEAKIQALLPRTQVVNTGGQTQIVNVDPLTGQPSVAGTLQNTATPSDLLQTVQGVSQDGTPYLTTKGQWLGGAAPGAPSAPAGGYTGRPQAASNAAVPAGALQTGLSPAEQARQTAGATAQANQAATAAQELHSAAADAPMRINLLSSARDALAKIQTGPGTDWRNTLASALQSTPALGEALTAMGVTDPKKIASYDEFKKIMTNYASSVSSSVGGGTDARLNAAITGNANPAISKLANDDILVKTIAAEKMRAAQDYAWQNAGLPPDKFNQWQSQWNKAVSPDAFAFVEMNPEQQRSFLERQKKGGTLNKFKTELGSLVRSGIIQMPGGQ